MTITIRGLPYDRLKVDGDIDTVLKVPIGRADRRFRIATSDGTLIQGTLSEGRYGFFVGAEGAGIVRVGYDTLGPVLTLEWRVEWVTIADHDDGAASMPPTVDLPLLAFM